MGMVNKNMNFLARINESDSFIKLNPIFWAFCNKVDYQQ